MLDFPIDNVSSEELERRRAVYGPLTQSVRELIDATIRTQVEADAVFEVKAQIDSATARLRSQQLDGAFGVRYTPHGQSLAWGNPVIGLRNPVAPPLAIQRDESGKVWADFDLGAAYEGPPGHVHGGICALILDHILGDAASAGFVRPTFTGKISYRYVRATPLGALHAEARIDRGDGQKTFAVGHLAASEGLTVEAEGVFIAPKSARG